jgi:hypothetical protein
MENQENEMILSSASSSASGGNTNPADAAKSAKATEKTIGKGIAQLADEINSTNIRLWANQTLWNAGAYYILDVTNIDDMILEGNESPMMRSVKMGGLATLINIVGSKLRRLFPSVTI